MAYGPSKTSALQTAVNAAVTLVAAELTAGLVADKAEVEAEFEKYRDKFKEELFASVAEEAAAAPQSSAPRGGGGGGGPRAVVSVDEAKATVLNFGAFKGVTLGEVASMTGAETQGYGFTNKAGDGRPGIEWLKWAAGNNDPKARFIGVRAQAILDSMGALNLADDRLLRDLSRG